MMAGHCLIVLTAVALTIVESLLIPPTTTPPPTNTPPPTTAPPPTTPPSGCYHKGKWYRPGSEISRGYDGRNWCYGMTCEEDGQVSHWDNLNCGPTTIPPYAARTTRRFRRSTRRPDRRTYTPTPTRDGCYHNGNWYAEGEEISRGRNGNWCYGSYCIHGQLVNWDDWNCGSSTPRPYTTPPPRPHPTTPQRTTRRFRRTTPGYPSTWRLDTSSPTPRGCYYNRKWYAPGEEISRGSRGNWCYGTSCSHDGHLLTWDGWNCDPTGPFTTHPPRPYTTAYPTTRRPTPQWTTRRYRRTTRRPWYPHIYPTTYPRRGCYYEGKWYRLGDEISRAYNRGYNWCYGMYCTYDGQVIPWDNFNCGPSTTPGPYTSFRYWTTKRPRRTTRRFRHTTRRPIYATMRFRTRRPDTYPTTYPRRGCYYMGKWYRPGDEISRRYNGRKWCSGINCSYDGQAIAWDDFNCRRPSTTPGPYTTSRYWTTKRPRGTTRRFRSTTRRPIYATMRYRTRRPRTYRPTPHRSGCYYKGKWYAPGEEISRGNDGSDWCYGTLCSERGNVVSWDDVPCITTPPPFTTPTPSLPTTFPPTTMVGCYHQGKWYPPNSEISRGSSYGWCYGTICDKHGQIIAWDDWRCSTTPEPTTVPTTAPIRGCYHSGTWFPPNSSIFQSSNGNGWCYGRRCSSDGQMILWDNFSCRNVGKGATGGCWYAGHFYAYGTELFRRNRLRRCFGGVCQLNGTIRKWKRLSCSMENKFLGGRLRPSWCKYKGKLYPRGSIVFSRSLSKKHGFGWCFGAKCGENGRIVTWGPVWSPGHC